MGCTTRIASIEAYILVANKDYASDAGLQTPKDSDSTASPTQRSLAYISDLHICAYPPQAQTCLVKITSDNGTVGWGEAHAPLGPRATQAVIQDVLAPLLVGADPLAIERHWEYMYGSMRLRGHVAGYQLEAIAGIDIALWDLTGKLLGLPVYRLLGGPFRITFPCYASGVPGKTIQERVTNAQHLIDAGYTAIKASIGRGDIDTDLASVAALAQVVRGHADLLIDAHGAYSAENALFVGRQLEAMGVFWFEDPLPPEDLAGYERLSAALDLAIAAGETECTRWQFEERLARHTVDIILPDICRAGGITEGRRIATVASLHNTRWAAHVSMGSSLHLAAAAHLAAASANFLICEFPSSPNPLGEQLLLNPFHPHEGLLTLPDKPGLGIEFNEEHLYSHILDTL